MSSSFAQRLRFEDHECALVPRKIVVALRDDLAAGHCLNCMANCSGVNASVPWGSRTEQRAQGSYDAARRDKPRVTRVALVG